MELGALFALVVARLVLGRNDDGGRLGRLAVLEAQRDLALGVGLEERRRAGMAVVRHLHQDLLAVVERRRHEIGGLVAGEAEHDALVAGALVLVPGGVDALGDVRGLRMEVVGELKVLPMEAVLLIADALDDVADRLLDLFANAGRPIAVLVHDSVAADFAGDDDAVGGGHRLAGDARLGVLGQEQVDDGVADLVRDLVGMAFGNGFGREQIGAAHGSEAVLEFQGYKEVFIWRL